MKYKNMREEELKNKVGADWFKNFDTTEILGNIDFTVFPKQNDIFGRTPLLWAEAKAVFDTGRELWRYYHTFNAINVNASLYDFKEFFQGRNDKGRMNSKSDDKKYMELIGGLRDSLNTLAEKIKPKVYEYEFLKE